MKLYRIKGWNDHYENNRSRKVIDLSWVPIPNRHDGENFSTIMAHADGAEIYAAWVLMLQVASRCQPRGSLVRDNGKPHTAESLALKTRGKQKWFEKALDFLCKHTDWLELEEVAPDCHQTAAAMPPRCQSGDEEGKGREENGMEGTEERGKVYSPECRAALHYLNQKTGKAFREVETNLAVIQARLKEPDVTIDGVRQMIDRQCALWKGSEMEEYLRPQTLFGKEKFDGYYAARLVPLPTAKPTNGTNGHAPAESVFAIKTKLEEVRKAKQRAKDKAAPDPLGGLQFRNEADKAEFKRLAALEKELAAKLTTT